VLGILGGAGLTTGNTAILTGDATVNGNLILGGGTDLFGNTNSGGNITVNNGSTVHGNATAAGSITLNGSGSITGTSTPFGSPASFSSVVLPSARSFTGGGPAQNIGSGGSLTLVPGTYGALTSASNATLHLSSGTYIFDSVSLGGTNQIDLTVSSGGPIIILVVGNFSTGSSLSTTLNGQTFANADPALVAKVYAESHGTWLIGGSGQWLGTIYTPSANLSFNNNVDLRGMLVSGAGLTLGGGSRVVNFVDSEVFGVPEPGSVALVGSGLLSLLIFAKRLRRG